MKIIVAIPGSSNSKSINKQLVRWAGSQAEGADTRVLDLNDFEMPIYSADRESESGIPQPAKNFVSEIENSDGIIVSLAEHNGSYAAAFKNILDWASRHKQKVWSDKPMLLMSTSPGGRGGQTVRASAENYFPYMGADIKSIFSLPKFHDNFKEKIIDEELSKEFKQALSAFLENL